MSFETTTTYDDKVIVHVKGNLDTMKLAADFKEVLQKLYDDDVNDVILDLNEVKLINSNGIGKILMFYKRFSDRGGQMYYLSPLEGIVKELFETLLLTNLLKEYKMG